MITVRLNFQVVEELQQTFGPIFRLKIVFNEIMFRATVFRRLCLQTSDSVEAITEIRARGLIASCGRGSQIKWIRQSSLLGCRVRGSCRRLGDLVTPVDRLVTLRYIADMEYDDECRHILHFLQWSGLYRILATT